MSSRHSPRCTKAPCPSHDRLRAVQLQHGPHRGFQGLGSPVAARCLGASTQHLAAAGALWPHPALCSQATGADEGATSCRESAAVPWPSSAPPAQTTWSTWTSAPRAPRPWRPPSPTCCTCPRAATGQALPGPPNQAAGTSSGHAGAPGMERKGRGKGARATAPDSPVVSVGAGGGTDSEAARQGRAADLRPEASLGVPPPPATKDRAAGPGFQAASLCPAGVLDWGLWPAQGYSGHHPPAAMCRREGRGFGGAGALLGAEKPLGGRPPGCVAACAHRGPAQEGERQRRAPGHAVPGAEETEHPRHGGHDHSPHAPAVPVQAPAGGGHARTPPARA